MYVRGRDHNEKGVCLCVFVVLSIELQYIRTTNKKKRNKCVEMLK